MDLNEKRDTVANFLDKKQRESYTQKLERMSEAELKAELESVELEREQEVQ